MTSVQPDSENQEETKRKNEIRYLSQQPFGATETMKLKKETWLIKYSFLNKF